MVQQLMDQPAGEAGPFAAAMAIVRLAHSVKITRPLLAVFPDLDDEVGWHQLLTMIVGVLLALPDQPIDATAARAVGLAMLEGGGDGDTE
jgi:hypothetical protein